MKLKTLAQVNPKAHYTFVPDKVGLHRPLILAKVARCISLWSQCEALVGQAVAFSLKGDNKLAMDMYLSITSPGAASGVRKVVTRDLPKQYREALEALNIVGKPLYTERSQLAHWLIGYSKNLKHSLLLLDPRDGLRQLTHNISISRAKEYKKARGLSPNDIRVLTGSYLSDLADRLQSHHFNLGLVVGALWQQDGGEWDHGITEQQFRWLYRDSQLVETILRLRGEKLRRPRSRARRSRSVRRKRR